MHLFLSATKKLFVFSRFWKVSLIIGLVVIFTFGIQRNFIATAISDPPADYQLFDEEKAFTSNFDQFIRLNRLEGPKHVEFFYPYNFKALFGRPDKFPHCDVSQIPEKNAQLKIFLLKICFYMLLEDPRRYSLFNLLDLKLNSPAKHGFPTLYCDQWQNISGGIASTFHLPSRTWTLEAEDGVGGWSHVFGDVYFPDTQSWIMVDTFARVLLKFQGEYISFLKALRVIHDGKFRELEVVFYAPKKSDYVFYQNGNLEKAKAKYLRDLIRGSALATASFNEDYFFHAKFNNLVYIDPWIYAGRLTGYKKIDQARSFSIADNWYSIAPQPHFGPISR